MHAGGDLNGLAKVTGVLSLTDMGCLGIDGTPLAAPPDSSFDGRTLRLPDRPSIRVGESLTTGGAYSTIGAAKVDGADKCGSKDNELILLNP